MQQRTGRESIANIFEIQRKNSEKSKGNCLPMKTNRQKTHTQKNKKKTKKITLWQKKVRRLRDHSRWVSERNQLKTVSGRDKRGKKLLFSRIETLMFWLLLPSNKIS